ncbi:MAG: hypothetical protein HYZ51_04440 [Candidatus Doudnabacteria bacterium]|nr:hypothetical protein [Candidatus Doudnabacteria bacterium]
MNKKAIAILAAIFLLIVGTLGFLIYSKNTANKEVPPKSEDNAKNAGNNAPVDSAPIDGGDNGNASTTPPKSAAQKFVELTSAPAGLVSPVLFYDGNGVTYLNGQGEMIKADFEILAGGQLGLTRERKVDLPKKTGIARVLWPKNGDDFIAEFTDFSGNKSYSYFNYDLGEYIDLPSKVKAVEWLPDGDKIIFVWVDQDTEGNDKATLNIAKPDTTEYQTIAQLYENDDLLYLSPDGLNLVFHRAKNTESTNKIVLTTPDGKMWKDLVKEGYNFGILWSPDSQKFLFGKMARDGAGYQLWYYDWYSGEVKNLGLMTVPVKAVWGSDSRTVYAAAPKDGEAIKDYADINNSYTADSFYKIDTATMEKTEHKPDGLTIDGRDLFLNSSEDKLFFKNAQDGGLYYLDLTQ